MHVYVCVCACMCVYIWISKCVCAYTSVCMCFCVHTYLHKCIWRPETDVGYFPQSPSTYFLRQGPQAHTSARLVQVPSCACLSAFLAAGLQTYTARPSFYVGTGYVNSGLCYPFDPLSHIPSLPFPFKVFENYICLFVWCVSEYTLWEFILSSNHVGPQVIRLGDNLPPFPNSHPTGSSYVAQAGLKFLAVVVPWPTKPWYYMCAPPFPTAESLLSLGSTG